MFVNIINGKTHRELRQIVEDLIEPEDVVLECACGTGLLSMVIAGKCKTLTATDFSRKMLERAKKNCSAYGNVTFSQADILKLAYPDNCFDKVVAGNVINLLDEPLKAVAELDRVCRPGGTLIIPTYRIKTESGGPADLLLQSGKPGKTEEYLRDER